MFADDFVGLTTNAEDLQNRDVFIPPNPQKFK